MNNKNMVIQFPLLRPLSLAASLILIYREWFIFSASKQTMAWALGNKRHNFFKYCFWNTSWQSAKCFYTFSGIKSGEDSTGDEQKDTEENKVTEDEETKETEAPQQPDDEEEVKENPVEENTEEVKENKADEENETKESEEQGQEAGEEAAEEFNDAAKDVEPPTEEDGVKEQ